MKIEAFLTEKQFEIVRKAGLDCKGVYIIINKELKKIYVGSSKKIVNRVYQHFNGKGSAYLFKDYVNNDSEWYIKLFQAKDEEDMAHVKWAERTHIKALTALGYTLYNEV